MQKVFVFLAVVALVMTCAAGALAWTDDFESGLGNWTQALANNDTLRPIALSTAQASSGTHSVVASEGRSGAPYDGMYRANDISGLNGFNFSAQLYLSSASTRFTFAEVVLGKNQPGGAYGAANRSWYFDDDSDRNGGVMAFTVQRGDTGDPTMVFKTGRLADAGDYKTNIYAANTKFDEWITFNVGFVGTTWTASFSDSAGVHSLGTGTAGGSYNSTWAAQYITVLGSHGYSPDSEGAWVDNISTGGSVPEPGSMFALATGLLGFVGLRKRFVK